MYLGHYMPHGSKKINYFPFSLIQINFYSTRDVVCGWPRTRSKHMMLFCIFWPVKFYWTSRFFESSLRWLTLCLLLAIVHVISVLLLWEIPPQGLITTCQMVPAPKNRTGSEWMEQTSPFSPYIFTKWWQCMSEFFLNRKITMPTKMRSAQPIHLT